MTSWETKEKKFSQSVKTKVDSKNSLKQNSLNVIVSVPTNHKLCRLYNIMQNIKCSLSNAERGGKDPTTTHLLHILAISLYVMQINTEY